MAKNLIPESNNPWWAPGRPCIVTDPNKLTYFARANAIRAGVSSSAGALSGVAVGDGDWADPYAGDSDGPGADRAFTSAKSFYLPTSSAGNRVVPRDVEGYRNSVDSSYVETPSGGSTLDSFFNSFNSFLSSPAPNQFGPQAASVPSPWPWVIGAGAVGVGLLWLSKRRAHR